MPDIIAASVEAELSGHAQPLCCVFQALQVSVVHRGHLLVLVAVVLSCLRHGPCFLALMKRNP